MAWEWQERPAEHVGGVVFGKSLFQEESISLNIFFFFASVEQTFFNTSHSIEVAVSLATQDILDHLNLGGMSKNFLLDSRQDQCLFCVLGAALNTAKAITALSHITALMSSFVFCSRRRKGTFEGNG